MCATPVPIRAEAIGFRYPGAARAAAPDKWALRDVSFVLDPGEIFGVLGPNGAGKTTLMKMLATVLVPHEGRLEVLGAPLPGGEEQVRARIGVAFAEYERAFHWRLTGRQNLEYFADFYAIPRRDVRARVERVLSQVGLAEAADRMFQTYSTGMKHRLALARALLPQPAVLLLDEPTAGLDARTARDLGETLRALAQGGTSVVYTTHRLEEASALCDRVLILREGRVAAMAAPSELARLAQDVHVLDVVVDGVLPDTIDQLATLAGVRGATLEGRAHLRVQATDLDAALPAVLGWLAAHALPVTSVATSAASLTDAFLAITEGRLGAAPPATAAGPGADAASADASAAAPEGAA